MQLEEEVHRWQSKAEEIELNAREWEQQANDANESLRVQATHAGKHSTA